jgi:hypothetical protein
MPVTSVMPMTTVTSVALVMPITPIIPIAPIMPVTSVMPVTPVSIIGSVIGPVRIVAVPEIDGDVDTRVRYWWPGEKQGQNERTGESNATQLH